MKIKKSSNGFTLVEVLVSAVILAIGVVIIFEVFLLSLDIVNLFNHRLNAQWFLTEKIWQVQDVLDQPLGGFIPLKDSGTVIFSNKSFDWEVEVELLDVNQELYKLDAQINWNEGAKTRTITRTTFLKRKLANVQEV